MAESLRRGHSDMRKLVEQIPATARIRQARAEVLTMRKHGDAAEHNTGRE